MSIRVTDKHSEKAVKCPVGGIWDPLREFSCAQLPFEVHKKQSLERQYPLRIFHFNYPLLICFHFILCFLFSWSQLVGRGTPECGSSDFAVVMSQSIFSSVLSVTAPSGLAPEAFLR